MDLVYRGTLASQVYNSPKIESLKPVTINATLEKRIPKYCNGTFISKVDQNGVVITLVTKTAVQQGSGEMAADNIVIESVFLDGEHAKNFANKILEVIASESNPK